MAPPDLFGVPWADLDAAHIAAFLVEAGEEPLLWEAKGGGSRPHPGSVRKAGCGFANSDRGGYLIVGADGGKGKPWTLNGVEWGVDEPKAWLERRMHELAPTPRVDSHVWKLGDGKGAAVVRVEPVAAPPCMTPDGVVYQRVSGATIPVTDPYVLAQLTARGRAAIDKAVAYVVELRDGLGEKHPGMTTLPHYFFTVAVVPVGGPYPRRALFRQATKDQLVELFVERFAPDRYESFTGARSQVRQRSLMLYAGRAAGKTWSLTIDLRGCGVRCSVPDLEVGIDRLMTEVVVPGWRGAASALEIIGATGRVAYTLSIDGAIKLAYGPEAGGRLDQSYMVTAGWTDEVQPADGEIDAVRREILTSAGFEAWEPD